MRRANLINEAVEGSFLDSQSIIYYTFVRNQLDPISALVSRFRYLDLDLDFYIR